MWETLKVATFAIPQSHSVDCKAERVRPGRCGNDTPIVPSASWRRSKTVTRNGRRTSPRRRGTSRLTAGTSRLPLSLLTLASVQSLNSPRYDPLTRHNHPWRDPPFVLPSGLHQITISIGWRHNVAVMLNLFKNPQPVYFFHSTDVIHIVESHRVPWHMSSLTRVKTGRAGLETMGGKQRCECD